MTSNGVSLTLHDLEANNKRLETQLNFANKCLDVLKKMRDNLNKVLNLQKENNGLFLTKEVIEVFRGMDDKYKQVLAQKPIKSEIIEENSLVGPTKQCLKTNLQNIIGNQSNKIVVKVVGHNSPENILTKSKQFIVKRVITQQKGATDLKQSCTVCPKPNLVFLSPITASDGTFKLLTKQTPIVSNQNNSQNISVVKQLPDIPKNNTLVKGHTIPVLRNNLNIGSDKSPETYPSHNSNYLSNRLKAIPGVSYKCIVNDCNKTYETLPLLECHQRESHEIESREWIDYNRICICDYPECGRHFSIPSKLKRHKYRVHNEEQKFKCDFPGCGKAYKYAYSLKIHRSLHFDAPDLHCSTSGCSFKTRSMGSLKTHEKTYHTNEKPFVCEFGGCTARFKSKNSLKPHLEAMHTNTSSVVCPVDGCGKLVKLHLLKIHIREHSKEYVSCDWPGCDYKCKCKGTIKKHKKHVHIGERNVVCDWPQCGKRFKSKFYLSVHRKRHTNDKQYACEWPGCEFREYSSLKVKIHFRTHTKEKPYACEWPGCEYRCAFGPNMKKHIKIHQK